MSASRAPWMQHRLVQWRTFVLGGAVIGCCLGLNLVILGLTPPASAPTAQATAEAPPAVTDSPTDASAALPATEGDGSSAHVVAASQESGPTETAAPAAEVAQATAPTPTDSSGSAPPTPQDPVAPSASPQTSAAPAPTPAPSTAPATPTTAPPRSAPPTTASTTAPSTTTPPTTAPSTTTPSTTAPSTTTAATTAPPTTTAANVVYPQYAVRDVGDVVLTYTNGSTIDLYAVYAGTGWVYEVERNGPRTVKIKFFNIRTENEAEWTAKIENSRIKVED